jgi:hypothetical protein
MVNYDPGGQHDVHDADAAHEQGNGRDHDEQHVVAVAGVLRLLALEQIPWHNPHTCITMTLALS